LLKALKECIRRGLVLNGWKHFWCVREEKEAAAVICSARKVRINTVIALDSQANCDLLTFQSNNRHNWHLSGAGQLKLGHCESVACMRSNNLAYKYHNAHSFKSFLRKLLKKAKNIFIYWQKTQKIPRRVFYL